MGSRQMVQSDRDFALRHKMTKNMVFLLQPYNETDLTAIAAGCCCHGAIFSSCERCNKSVHLVQNTASSGGVHESAERTKHTKRRSC